MLIDKNNQTPYSNYSGPYSPHPAALFPVMLGSCHTTMMGLDQALPGFGHLKLMQRVGLCAYCLGPEAFWM